MGEDPAGEDINVGARVDESKYGRLTVEIVSQKAVAEYKAGTLGPNISKKRLLLLRPAIRGIVPGNGVAMR